MCPCGKSIESQSIYRVIVPNSHAIPSPFYWFSPPPRQVAIKTILLPSISAIWTKQLQREKFKFQVKCENLHNAERWKWNFCGANETLKERKTHYRTFYLPLPSVVKVGEPGAGEQWKTVRTARTREPRERWTCARLPGQDTPPILERNSRSQHVFGPNKSIHLAGGRR